MNHCKALAQAHAHHATLVHQCPAHECKYCYVHTCVDMHAWMYVRDLHTLIHQRDNIRFDCLSADIPTYIHLIWPQCVFFTYFEYFHLLLCIYLFIDLIICALNAFHEL